MVLRMENALCFLIVSDERVIRVSILSPALLDGNGVDGMGMGWLMCGLEYGPEDISMMKRKGRRRETLSSSSRRLELSR